MRPKGPGCAEIGGSGCNLYLYDFGKPAHGRLSLVPGGLEVLGVAGIAEDGTRVYFVARDAPAAAGANTFGKTPEPGQPNLYVYDSASETLVFIATLGGGDSQDWEREFSRPVEVSGEGGRFLLFASSQEGLTPEDETSATQLFEYDAATGELVRVTQGEDGYNKNGIAVAAGVNPTSIANIASELLGANGEDFKSTTNLLNMSADGKTVVFLTAGQLSPLATAGTGGCSSLYEFHSGGAIADGSVSLLSDGRDAEPHNGVCGAGFFGMDGSGDNVLFSTADPLLPGDVDGVERDVYDARVDGGFVPVVEGGLCGSSDCGGSVGRSSVLGVSSGVSVAPEVAVPGGKPGSVSGKDSLSRRLGWVCLGRRSLRVLCGRAGANRGGQGLVVNAMLGVGMALK